MSDTPTSNKPTEMTGAKALGIVLRRFTVGSLAVVGAFAIGMGLILATALFFSQDDDGWDNDPFIADRVDGVAVDDGFFDDTVRPEPLGGGGLFPDDDPVRVDPSPRFNAVPTSIEYRVGSRNNSLDLRSTGGCGNDVRYAITETDQEIQVAAQADSSSQGCTNSDWVTISLNNPVGDRIVVNSEAGLTARPVVR